MSHAQESVFRVWKELYEPFVLHNKKTFLVYTILVLILYFIQTLVFPRFFTQFITSLNATMKQKTRTLILYLIITFLCMCVVSFGKNMFDASLSTQHFQFIRQSMYHTIMKCMETSVKTVRLGEFMTILNFLPREIRYLSDLYMNMIPGVMGYLYIFLYVLWVDPRISVFLLMGVGLTVWVLLYSPFSRSLQQQSKDRAVGLLQNNTLISEELNQLEHVIVNNEVNHEIEKNVGREVTLQQKFETSVRTASIMTQFLLLSNVFVFTLVGYCLYHSSQNKKYLKTYVVTVGFYINLLWGLVWKYVLCIVSTETIGVYYTYYQRLLDDSCVSQTTTPQQTTTETTPREYDPQTWSITFDKVSFRYPNSDVNVLTDFSWEIPLGSRWFLTSPSGTGKSTVFRLLTRMIQPTSGHVYANANDPHKKCDLSDIPIDIWRDGLYLVHQDTLLFEKTIYENIVYGLSDDEIPTQHDLLKTLQTYDLDRVFGKDKNVLDKDVGTDGRHVSKGQQKVIFIARALLKKKKKVYLFDEPLASLDPSTQKNIISWIFDTITPNQTVIVTSHVPFFSLTQTTDFQLKRLETSG